MDQIISFLLSLSSASWYLPLKLAFILISLVLLVWITVLFFKTSWFKFLIMEDATEFLTFRPFGVRKIVKTWKAIMARLDTSSESEFKLAVLEADSLMDDILRRMGHGGAALGDRLKNLTSATLPNIEDLKQAHQTRNNIVHDPDFRFSRDEAKKDLDVFYKALSDLQAF